MFMQHDVLSDPGVYSQVTNDKEAESRSNHVRNGIFRGRLGRAVTVVFSLSFWLFRVSVFENPLGSTPVCISNMASIKLK